MLTPREKLISILWYEWVVRNSNGKKWSKEASRSFVLYTMNKLGIDIVGAKYIISLEDISEVSRDMDEIRSMLLEKKYGLEIDWNNITNKELV